MAGWRQILTDALVAGVNSALRSATSEARSGTGSRSGRSRSRASGSGAGTSRRPGRPGPRDRRQSPDSDSYPGDFTSGDVRITYAPRADGQPDPGEVVWAWVPYEEDHRRGKDRPALVVAEQGGHLIALMLTSKDHDADAAQEARAGRIWLDVGTGDWDAQRRPSEVRLDRVLRLDPARVRREGGRLPRDRFDEVADALRELHGWT